MKFIQLEDINLEKLRQELTKFIENYGDYRQDPEITTDLQDILLKTFYGQDIMIRLMGPPINHSPDFSPLKSLCQSEIDSLIDGKTTINEIKDYIFRQTIECLYGSDGLQFIDTYEE